MTLYLTDTTSPRGDPRGAAPAASSSARSSILPARRRIPMPASPPSRRSIPALEAMEDCGLVFQVHGEVTDADVDVFDRERVFIDRILTPGRRALSAAAHRVRARDDARSRAVRARARARGVGATITPQHLLLNRNAIFQGGIRPHNYCLPVLKREHDRQALIEAATSDDARFFLGTDSAPHAKHTKETLAAAPACSPRTRPSSCTRKRSSRRATRSPAGVRLRARAGLLRPAAQQRAHHARARSLDAAGSVSLRRGRAGAVPRRRAASPGA